MTLSNHISVIQSLKEKQGPGAKVGMVSGNFNVVHPGHLRLLKFAADCCDILTVAVNRDDVPGVLMPASLRLEGIEAISLVDHAFIMDDSMEKVIANIKPDLIVKGKEHENLHNPEAGILAQYGGKLLFSEHGKAPDAKVHKWQNRINPFWKIIGGGCNINRDIPQLLKQGGFDIKELDTLYMPQTPRIAGYTYWGYAS